tara:strand:+ start:1458 stop:2114 length:657 start_codon:yes stop_codon:yes gene_type:complete
MVKTCIQTHTNAIKMSKGRHTPVQKVLKSTKHAKKTNLSKIRTNKLSVEYHFKRLYQPTVATFTESDRAVKLEICGVTHFRECFVCKNNNGKSIKAGDHLYECTGYRKYSGGYGIDGKWNTLPVCLPCNYSYKKIRCTDGRVRDAGLYDIPIELVPPQKKYIVETISAWKAYVAQRGVVLHFNFDDRQQSVYEGALRKYEEFVAYMEKITEHEIANKN